MTMITRPKTRAIPTAPRDPPYSALATIAPAPAKTSVNAARPSAPARRGRSGRRTVSLAWLHLGQQRPDTLEDLIADLAHGRQVLAGRVLELPVLVALARIDRAGVAAAHRDHHVRGAHGLVRQRLGELLGHLHAQLVHRLEHRRVDPVGRVAARGANMDAPLRAELHEARGHLATARVVHADEQHLRLLPHGHSFDRLLEIDSDR